jgi:lipopolysaccharide export system protein LptA
MMKTRSLVSFNIFTFIIFVLFSQMIAFSQESKEPNQTSTENPIIIYSDTLELDQEKKEVIFKGNVKANTNDMVIDCQTMLVYYHGSPMNEKANIESSRIDKIVALGDVIINRHDGSMARAEKAVFYQDEQKIVLTENPLVQQGADFVEGKQITIFLNDNRSIVEGNGKKRVKATIFPKEEKGEK